MSSKVRGRGGRVQRLFGGQCALHPKFCSKSAVSKGVGLEGCERSGSVLDSKTSRTDNPQDSKLTLELCLDTLKSPSAASHATKPIAVRIALRIVRRRVSGAVEKSNELDDGGRARAEGLLGVGGSCAPDTRAQLPQAELEETNKGGTLASCPSRDEKSRQPMHALVVGRPGTGLTLHEDEHVVRDQSTLTVECEQRSPASPVSPLRPRGEHVVERRSALGRSISKTSSPVSAREMPVSVIESKVNDVCDRGASVEQFSPARDGCEFVVNGSGATRAAFPPRARNDVEIARGDAPAGEQDVPHDGLEGVCFTIALMGAVGGDESNERLVVLTPPMAKVHGDRHGCGIELGRATRARLALEPREQDAPGGTRGAIGAPPDSRPSRIEVGSISSSTEPRAEATRMRRITERSTNLVENNVCRCIVSAYKRIENVVARCGDSLLAVRTRLPIPTPPASRIPHKQGFATR